MMFFFLVRKEYIFGFGWMILYIYIYNVILMEGGGRG